MEEGELRDKSSKSSYESNDNAASEDLLCLHGCFFLKLPLEGDGPSKFSGFGSLYLSCSSFFPTRRPHVEKTETEKN